MLNFSQNSSASKTAPASPGLTSSACEAASPRHFCTCSSYARASSYLMQLSLYLPFIAVYTGNSTSPHQYYLSSSVTYVRNTKINPVCIAEAYPSCEITSNRGFCTSASPGPAQACSSRKHRANALHKWSTVADSSSSVIWT